jgi:hypothetical protein
VGAAWATTRAAFAGLVFGWRLTSAADRQFTPNNSAIGDSQHDA